MSSELKNLKKQRDQSIKNMDYYQVFADYSIHDELAYYNEIENLKEIESQIIELNLI